MRRTIAVIFLLVTFMRGANAQLVELTGDVVETNRLNSRYIEGERLENGRYQLGSIDDVKDTPLATIPRTHDLKQNGFNPGWYVFEVVNKTETTNQWRFDSRTPYLRLGESVYISQDDAVRVIASGNPYYDNFKALFPTNRKRQSDWFALAPEESATIWIRSFNFSEKGSLEQEFWITTPDGAAALAAQDAHTFGGLMGVRLAFIVTIFAFAWVLRDMAAVYYGLFALAISAFYLSEFGYVYAHVLNDPGADYLFNEATRFLGLVFFSLMTMAFLRTRQYFPRLHNALLAAFVVYIAAALLARALEILRENESIPVLGAFLVVHNWILSAATFSLVGINTTAAVLAIRRGYKGASWFAVAASFLLANNIYEMLGSSGFRLTGSWIMTDTILFAGYTIDMVLFAAALVVRATALRRERDLARDAELTAFREQALLRGQLKESEGAARAATTLAEVRRQELAAASHDLKQPLLSLRMAMKNAEEGRKALTAGLNYIESVVTRNLERTGPDAHPAPASAPLSLDHLFDNVCLMFGDEAEAKGISLANVRSNAKVDVDAAVIMRILTNLTANAIKHTPGGRVLIGVKRNGDRLNIRVYDTGPGMTPEEINAAMQPYVKGEASTGEGLGLFVVKAMAEEQGLQLNIASTPGRGTLVEISGVRRAN